MSQFQEDLQEIIDEITPKQYDLEELGKIDLWEYDFSEAQVDIVASIPGKYHDELIAKFGHVRVMSLLKQYNFPKMKNRKMVCQGSSLGKMSKNWLKEMYTAFTLDSDMKEENIRIVFPTCDYVQNSHFGINGGGTTFLSEKTFNTKTWPKQCLAKFLPPVHSNPSLNSHLSHSKIIISANPDFSFDENTIIYVGSHNFSQAA